MVITFKDKRLGKCANDPRKGLKELGSARHEKFVARLDQLRGATVLEDIRHSPGRFHELREDRKGQWGCSLDEPYRLILTPNEDPIPLDEAGNFDWSAIRSIEVVEIINYHKEK